MPRGSNTSGLRPFKKGVSGNPLGRAANPLGKSSLRGLRAKIPQVQADQIRKFFPSLKKNATYADALTALLINHALAGLARPDASNAALRCLELLSSFVECNRPRHLDQPIEGPHGKIGLADTIEQLAATYGLTIKVPRDAPQTVDVMPMDAPALPPAPERTQ